VKTRLKTFRVFVQFDSLDLNVKAKNLREAKQKVAAKMKSMPAFRVMDKKNYFVDEA
jgi:hypothetical protein